VISYHRVPNEDSCRSISGRWVLFSMTLAVQTTAWPDPAHIVGALFIQANCNATTSRESSYRYLATVRYASIHVYVSMSCRSCGHAGLRLSELISATCLCPARPLGLSQLVIVRRSRVVAYTARRRHFNPEPRTVRLALLWSKFDHSSCKMVLEWGRRALWLVRGAYHDMQPCSHLEIL
jgi:hypothetical protein